MKNLFALITITGVLFSASLSVSGQDWNKDLTPEQKIYILSKIWKDVGENFAFFENVPDLDWDKQYQEYIPKILATKTKYETYRLLERFICSLKDGHTYMFHFNELFPHYKRFGFNGTLKIVPTNINKRVFIMRVGTKEMTKTIPLGTEILEVNNQPVKQYLEENVFPFIAASTEHALWNLGVSEMFRGVIDVENKPNPEWNVKFKKPDGVMFEMKLKLSDGFDGMAYPAYPEVKPIDFKWLDNQIVHVTINTFAKDEVLTIFKSQISQLKNAKGIILDIRANGGGNSNISAGILSYFTNENDLIGSKWKTRTTNAYYKANGYFARNRPNPDEEDKMFLLHYQNNSWIDGGLTKFANTAPKEDRLLMPLVVLTGNQTASAAEDFLIMLDGLKNRAITIGQRTNGSTGQPLFVKIPTGGSYQICTKKDTYPDGRKFVGVGIIPNIEIEPSVEDVLNVNDVILKKAIEVFKENKYSANSAIIKNQK